MSKINIIDTMASNIVSMLRLSGLSLMNICSDKIYQNKTDENIFMLLAYTQTCNKHSQITHQLYLSLSHFLYGNIYIYIYNIRL